MTVATPVMIIIAIMIMTRDCDPLHASAGFGIVSAATSAAKPMPAIFDKWRRANRAFALACYALPLNDCHMLFYLTNNR